MLRMTVTKTTCLWYGKSHHSGDDKQAVQGYLISGSSEAKGVKMTTLEAASTLGRVDSKSRINTGVSTRIAFLDHVRTLMVLLVVVYHAVAAYSAVAPHWWTHDTTSFVSDIVREWFDVFLMPVLFFIAGYFALSSIEKKGTWGFLKDKVKRLLIPWALAVLVVNPLAVYDQPSNLIRPFWNYWLQTMSHWQVQLISPAYGPQIQSVYWFISLLFAFFVLFALGYGVTRRWRGQPIRPAVRPATAGNSTLVTLLLFGLLTCAAYFVSLLLMPEATWFRLGVFLEFQVPRLALFAGYFALGLYAQSRGWFTDGKPLGSLAVWGAISVVLSAVYLVVFQPVVADLGGTSSLSVGLAMAFAFVRSFLILSLLIVLVSVGARYWNRSRGLERQLGETSYNIYLTHIWFVVVAQEALMEWTGGLALAKIAIVLVMSLVLSFALSKWVIGRHARVFTAALMALFVFCLAARP
jgi:glucan biosynthesis protein C